VLSRVSRARVRLREYLLDPATESSGG